MPATHALEERHFISELFCFFMPECFKYRFPPRLSSSLCSVLTNDSDVYPRQIVPSRIAIACASIASDMEPTCVPSSSPSGAISSVVGIERTL